MEHCDDFSPFSRTCSTCLNTWFRKFFISDSKKLFAVFFSKDGRGLFKYRPQSVSYLQLRKTVVTTLSQK